MKRVILYMLVCALKYGMADVEKNLNNYGPYVVEWEHFDQCRGPKLSNLSTLTTELIKSENNTYRGILNITFLEPLRVDEIKMSVYSIKNNVKTILWNYIVNKPCQHYVVAALLETHMKAKNCQVKPATFYADLNLSELMNSYIGKSFFYGEYYFKVVITSKKGNVACFMFDPKFKKKKN